MSSHCKIGPSSSLDLSRGLEAEENRAVLDTNPEYLHLDISDGCFVSAAVSFGSEMVQTLRERLPNTFLDVHMMVKEPEKWVDKIASAGGNQFTFHLEATKNPIALIKHVQSKGMKVGTAINPGTPVEDVLPYAGKVDSILIMTVKPGSGYDNGQTVNKNNSAQKVETLQQMCPDLDVKTDGWDILSATHPPRPGTPSSAARPEERSPVSSNSHIVDQRPRQNGTGTPTRSNSKTKLLRGSVDHTVLPSYGSLQTTDVVQSRRQSVDEAFRVGDPYGSGPSYLVVPPKQRASISSVRCECHVKVVDKTAKRAKIKLILASIIALAFMAGEVVGGYFAGSLAIMTDAAHMLSDFAGFLISLFAIWLASRPSSNRMSFGWHRAEVMGAVISVLIIWVITGVLFYEAVQRVINPKKVDADIMLITACIGVFVNVFMCMVLHPHSHGHGHGHSHSSKKKNQSLEESRQHKEDEESGCGNGRGQKRKFWQRKKKQHGSEENINVRAAFIHVIGDLIQSVGVVIAGYVIKFKPTWTIVDPICTFIFCVLVLISTLNVLKDALRVLMEGTPKHIDYKGLKEDLEKVTGVKKAHSLHIWSLTLNRTALAAHLVIESSANHQTVLNEASEMLKERYNITSTTLQVENHHDLMEECGTCQETDKTDFCNFTCWPL